MNRVNERSEYYSIPYAMPPIGEFRWQDPQPKMSWTGLLPARSEAPGCMQVCSNVADNHTDAE